MTRRLQDGTLEITTAFPAAGANATTESFDLGQTSAAALENIAVELDIPAVAAVADNKSVTFTLYESDDNSTFAAIDPLISTTITGEATNKGSPAKRLSFRLPAKCKRYIAVNVNVPADAGTLTASSFSFRLLF